MQRTLKRIAVDLRDMETLGALCQGGLRGVLRYAREVSSCELLFNREPLSEFESFSDFEDLGKARADGLLVFADRAASNAARIKAAGVTVVVIGGPLTPQEFPCVLEDHEHAGRLAARHLLEKGFRRFAFFGVLGPAVSLRCASFAVEIRTAGHPCASYRFHGAPRGSSLHSLAVSLRGWARMRQEDALETECDLSQWLGDLAKPVGIMASLDKHAMFLLRKCCELGLAVPEEVAVVGAGNNTLICESFRPTLSSVDMNGERIGYEAARMLHRLLEGKRPPSAPLKIPPRGVVTRASSDILAVGDPIVSKALAFIREHLSDPVGLEDIVHHSATSCAALESRFRALLGRTVGAEVQKQRIERAKQLMLDTDLPPDQIAPLVGYSAGYFHHVFAEKAGMPPGRWRREHR